MTKPALLLGSGSKIRANMLKEQGLTFQVASAECDEAAIKRTFYDLPKAELALKLAHAKAAALLDHYPEHRIVTADQMCEVHGHSLSKPGNEANAIKQLQELSGETHFQHSAACIYYQGRCEWEVVETAELTMKELSDEEIEDYVRKDKPFSSCGAYMFEKNGADLFEKVKGDEAIILGLPLKALMKALNA